MSHRVNRDSLPPALRGRITKSTSFITLDPQNVWSLDLEVIRTHVPRQRFNIGWPVTVTSTRFVTGLRRSSQGFHVAISRAEYRPPITQHFESEECASSENVFPCLRIPASNRELPGGQLDQGHSSVPLGIQLPDRYKPG